MAITVDSGGGACGGGKAAMVLCGLPAKRRFNNARGVYYGLGNGLVEVQGNWK